MRNIKTELNTPLVNHINDSRDVGTASGGVNTKLLSNVDANQKDFENSYYILSCKVYFKLTANLEWTMRGALQRQLIRAI